HTRFSRDWSSDVCSSDLAELAAAIPQIRTQRAKFPPGEYRGIRGSDALAFGIAAAGELADRPVIFCSYPITPASPLLHRLAQMEIGRASCRDRAWAWVQG